MAALSKQAIRQILTAPHPDYCRAVLKILDKDKRLARFTLNEPQLLMQNWWDDDLKKQGYIRWIILKPRQIGSSTFTTSHFFRKYHSTPGWNAIIVGHRTDSATNMRTMIERYHNNLPDVLKPALIRRNEKVFAYADRESGIEWDSCIALATAEARGNVGVSGTVGGIHLTEFSRFADAALTWTSLMPSLKPQGVGTIAVVESTAFGYNFFHQLWEQAVSGDIDYRPIFIPFTMLSEYEIHDKVYSTLGTLSDEEQELIDKHGCTEAKLRWRRYAIANICGGSIEQFHQEFPVTPEQAFISSGSCYFDTDLCQRMAHICPPPKHKGMLRKNDKGKVQFEETHNGFLRIWELPQKDGVYLIGADVGGNKFITNDTKDTDKSVAYVARIDGGFRVVATLDYNQYEHIYARDLDMLGTFYNTALLAPERNGQGRAVVLPLSETYPNLYAMEKNEKWTPDLTEYPGWITTSANRPTMLSDLHKCQMETPTAFPDPRLWTQCLQFVLRGGGKYEAEQGCHDDHVFAAAILLQLYLRSRPESGDTTKSDDEENAEEYRSVDIYTENGIIYIKRNQNKELDEEEDVTDYD